MPLPFSGPLSISMINTELGRTASQARSSLSALALLAKTDSTPYLNRTTPKISHWYGYRHAPVYLKYGLRSIASGVSATCSLQSGNIFSLYGDNPTLTVGMTFYDSPSLDIKFNGGGFQFLAHPGKEALLLIQTNGVLASINTCSISDTTPPSAPVLNSTSYTNQPAIYIFWTESTDDTFVSSYELWRSINNGAYFLIDIVDVETNPYIDTIGLQPGKIHKYKMRAFDSAGNVSAYSNEIQRILTT